MNPLSREIAALLVNANQADVAVVVIVTDLTRAKTGLMSNLNQRFPQSDTQSLLIDTLQFAIQIAQGDVPNHSTESTYG